MSFSWVLLGFLLPGMRQQHLNFLVNISDLLFYWISSHRSFIRVTVQICPYGCFGGCPTNKDLSDCDNASRYKYKGSSRQNVRMFLWPGTWTHNYSIQNLLAASDSRPLRKKWGDLFWCKKLNLIFVSLEPFFANPIFLSHARTQKHTHTRTHTHAFISFCPLSHTNLVFLKKRSRFLGNFLTNLIELSVISGSPCVRWLHSTGSRLKIKPAENLCYIFLLVWRFWNV